MQSDFVRDLRDCDQPIRDSFAERDGKPIRLRIQPAILRDLGEKGWQYRGWKDVRWTLECENVAETLACRDAMRLFFEVLARLGPGVVQQALGAMNAVNQARDTGAANAGRASAGKEARLP